jgi:hypothetical protein
MTRRMSEPAYRHQQLRDLYAPHVKAINKLVDELRVPGERWMPHVAPLHGGSSARLLLLESDPGQADGDLYESMLSVEDDNARAARLGALLKAADIEVSDTLVWCGYPWYARHLPTPADLKAGVEPLRRVLELLDRLEVVILLGGSASRSWRMLTSTHAYDVPRVRVLVTRDTDDEAFAGTNAQRKKWRNEQAQVFQEASRLVQDL